MGIELDVENSYSMDLSREEKDRLLKAAEQMEANAELIKAIHSSLIGDPLNGRVGYLSKIDSNAQSIETHNLQLDILNKKIEDTSKYPWKSVAATGGGGLMLGAYLDYVVMFFKQMLNIH